MKQFVVDGMTLMNRVNERDDRWLRRLEMRAEDTVFRINRCNCEIL